MITYIEHSIKKNEIVYKFLKRVYSGAKSIAAKITRKDKNFSHEYSVKEIIMQQNRPDGYNRLDIFVRLLAVEEEYGLNDFGWNLYRKMQSSRCSDESLKTEQRVGVFKELIKSWKDNGYDHNYEIFLDKNFNLNDGSHRLALALFHGVATINCNVLMMEYEVNYGEDWFRKNGFDEKEIMLINEKTNEYLDNLKVLVTCILWPAVFDFFDEITEKISRQYKIESSVDLTFSNDTFERYLRGVYKIDDIDTWKIDKKIEHLSIYSDKKVRLIVINVDYPRFRFNLNKNTILIQGEELKAKIRGEYKEKINNYFYDIIFYTGDNVSQSEYIEKLSKPCFSLRELFEIIKDKRWEIIKFETINLPSDFPDSFPFSKDIDIICDENDIQDIVNESKNYLVDKCKNYYDEIRVVTDGSNRYEIRVEIHGYLVFQLDFSSRVEGVDDKFIKDSLNRRKYVDCYYITSPEDEICFRVNESINYPLKIHHVLYLKENRKDIDIELVKNNIVGGLNLLESLGLSEVKNEE